MTIVTRLLERAVKVDSELELPEQQPRESIEARRTEKSDALLAYDSFEAIDG